MKACKLYLMKEFIKELVTSLQDFGNPTLKSYQTRFSTSSAFTNTKTIKNLQPYTQKSMSFGNGYLSAINDMLHLLLYKNTKVWNVMATVLDEKYDISEFKGVGNGMVAVNELVKKIDMGFMILKFL